MYLPNTAGGRAVLNQAGVYTGGVPVFAKRGIVGVQAYYTAGQSSAVASTTGTPTVDTLRAFPFMVAEDCTIDRLGIGVTTNVATAVGRIGIYDSTTDLYPGALIGESGQFDLSTIGAIIATVSIPVQRGVIYWAAHLAGTAAGTIRCLGMNCVSGALGAGASLGSAVTVGWSHAQAYGVMPSAFPSATPAGVTGTPIPACHVRLS